MQAPGDFAGRPKSYYNIDGVGELGIGFMCLSFALLEWLQIHSRQDSVWNQMYTMFLYIGLLGALIHYGSKAIKSRITYPRTGFVQYRQRDTVWGPLFAGLGFSLAAAVGLFLAIRSHWNLTTPASLAGLVFAASYAHGIAKTVRWKWLVAGTMAAASVVIAMLPPRVVGALANGSWVTRFASSKLVGSLLFSLTLYGALLLISGGISFWLYLRHNPVQARP